MVLLAALGLAGILFLEANPSANVLAANRAVSVLHVVSAACAAAALALKARTVRS